MDSNLLVPKLDIIKGLLILDSNGRRVLAHYYNSGLSTKEQRSFEKKLFRKTFKTNVEVLMLEGFTVLYKPSVDLYFYVLGSVGENELLLLSVLNCFHDSISLVLRKQIEKKALIANMGTVMLAIDEICDQGIILETSPSAVVSRVTLRSEDIPIGEQTVAQVFQSAKEQLKQSLLR